MFQHQGVWLPDGEQHFPEWMTKNGELVDGKGTYQIKKFRAAMEHCKAFRTAVDVGGHVGLWSMQLAKRFAFVHAFEPVEAFRDCFLKNVSMKDVKLHDYALGAEAGVVTINVNPADTGGTHVAGKADLRSLRNAWTERHRPDVDMYRFDDLIPLGYEHFTHIDFVKIDCEGYEHHVLEGMRETLARCRPCVIVEQKPHKLGPNFGIKGTPAVDLLKSMGAVVRREIGGDYIMSWEG